MCSAPDFFTIDKLNLDILNKLIDKTSCIFTDPQHTSKAANQLAKKFDIKSRELDLLGHNVSLGKKSYIDFLSKLSETVVECLK